jgi:hypothetical protein
MVAAETPSKLRNLSKGGADAGLVGLDLLQRQDEAALVLAGRIADPRRTPSHQGNRPVPGLLEPAQHHDGEKMADMQRWTGAIVSDIGGDRARLYKIIKALRVGALVDVAAFLENAEEV